MPRPTKMSHSFTQNRCWTTLQAPQHEGWRLESKMEGKTNSSRQLNQLAWLGLARLTRPPDFTTEYLRYCSV